MEQQKLKDILIIALIITGVIGFGMLAFNQTMGWFYKSELLQKPCQLCVELNPNFTRCNIELQQNLITNYPEINYSKYIFINNTNGDK